MSNKISRREFLNAAGLAAAAAGAATVACFTPQTAQPVTPAEPSRSVVEAALLKLAQEPGPNLQIIREMIERNLADIAQLEEKTYHLALAVLAESGSNAI